MIVQAMTVPTPRYATRPTPAPSAAASKTNARTPRRKQQRRKPDTDS